MQALSSVILSEAIITFPSSTMRLESLTLCSFLRVCLRKPQLARLLWKTFMQDDTKGYFSLCLSNSWCRGVRTRFDDKIVYDEMQPVDYSKEQSENHNENDESDERWSCSLLVIFFPRRAGESSKDSALEEQEDSSDDSDPEQQVESSADGSPQQHVALEDRLANVKVSSLVYHRNQKEAAKILFGDL